MTPKNNQHYTFSELVDTKTFQDLMEKFYACTDIPCALLDNSGNVLVAIGWQEICVCFHRKHPETLAKCKESDMEIARHLHEKKATFFSYKCANGLNDVAIPIIIENQHLGSFFFGQFFYDDDSIDIEFFRKQALIYGFDEKKYLEAYQKIPTYSHDHVDKIMQFYSGLANFLIYMGIENIKHRKSAHDATLFRQFAEAAGQGFGMGTFDAEITYVNPALCKMVGETEPDNLIGNSFIDVYSSENQEYLKNVIMPTVLKEGQWTGELSFSLPDGRHVETLENYFLLTDENNQPRYIADLVTDFTEYKKMERELKRYQEELEERVKERTAQLAQSNEDLQKEIGERRKVESALREKTEALKISNRELEEFAYVASHDLREPLRKISTFADLLSKKYQSHLDEKGERYIYYMVDAANRLQEMIDALLHFSRVSRKAFGIESLDLNTIINHVLNDLEMVIQESKATINYSDLPVIQGNQKLIRMLFQNLISNAIKYRKDNAPSIKISAIKESHTWHFTVTDNGIGIAPNFSERIFGIFQRLHTHDEYPGSGIGLSICRKIINQYNGKIWVESDVGQGATFHIVLPQIINRSS